MYEAFQNLGFSPADILFPREGIDLTKWAVIACDQFSSQPDYWQAVARTVGDAPSTLRLILPEAELKSPEVDRHIRDINAAMERYWAEGVWRELGDTLIYVERTQSDGRVRHGLVGKIDLDRYDFTPGSGALIRATEGTVLSRIPPRVRVRRDAPVELPHVMLLMDDPADTVLGPLRGLSHGGALYDFPLQQGGGVLRGWTVPPERMDGIAGALSALADPKEMERKYGLSGVSPLLFAVGDGNHSLAAAKQCYEDRKRETPPEQWALLPERYALAEVVNLHDPALEFEPIHRCVSGVSPEDLLRAFREAWPSAVEGRHPGHVIEFVWAGQSLVLTVPDPRSQLAVGTLQSFLDEYLDAHGGDIDYIHGDQAARDLGNRPGCMAFLLPPMGKDQFFKTVMADGVLPRKTFSMGQARDKRYYLEGRRLRT